MKHRNLISLGPIRVLLVSVLFPLQPVVWYAMIGILLVAFDVEAMAGFSLWS